MNICFCSPKKRGTFLDFSQASNTANILLKPDDTNIDSALECDSQIYGKELLTQGHVKPKLGFVLSSTYTSDICMHCQVSLSGGKMGGVSWLPPSNTMTSSSIFWINNLCWLHRMATSQSTHCCLSYFFLAWQLQQWWAILNICCWECAIEAHWVQRDKDDEDFETQTQLGTLVNKKSRMQLLMRTLKHEPNWGHRWMCNHVCNCP